MQLNTPISQLNRVGKATAKKMERLGIKTALDLLYFFPFRYEDFRRLVPISELKDGETITIRGRVELIANKRSFKKRKIITEALISDESGSVRVVWFNQPFLTKILKIGDVVFLSGKTQADMLGLQFVSPVYEKANKDATTHTARLVPIYPLTAGLTQKQTRFLESQIVGLSQNISEWIPEIILEKFDLAPISEALRGIHFPEDDNDLKQSVERLKFNEWFLLQFKAETARMKRNFESAPILKFKEKEIQDFVKALPFTLTKSQKISAWEILQDITKGKPMNRLLSGDVGSGKTVVAAMAAYSAFLNGYQAAIMAPTEILATQHYNTMVGLLGDKARLCLLTRSQCQISNLQFPINDKIKISKNVLLKEIRNKKVSIIIGTHALLSEKVEFEKLGLVVVDEQHRFGVEQRKIIKEKGGASSNKKGIHFLSMTATPIPRSLALTIYGDLDVSIIDELPLGRKKVLTRLVEPVKREKAYQFIREQIKAGRQAFVICPLIFCDSESETCNLNLEPRAVGAEEKKSVMAEYEKLSKKIFTDLKIGYLHGKQKAKEKEDTMAKFKNKEIDILVSTSVVEVGVDISNASVMMIENADRFGLAQLHQFRGRVGRAEHQSYCLLFTESDAVKATERLRYFEKENNGFKLADKDLEMRGPGEVYGTEQSGMMNLRLAKLTDIGIIKKAKEAARLLAPEAEKYPILAKKMKELETAHLE
ncbi:MAG: ATP-dependent DNA helicase RecG [Patescibacteria group bacterium]|nr:ATP-dependent DNA helicase RecG [Patescibacteria group bacterium]